MANHPTRQDLMLAILSLDAYMRGPELKAAIQGLDETIGEFSLEKVASKNLPDSSISGFEAVSYTSGTDTIISFRGTDFDLGNFDLFAPSTWGDASEFVKDVGNGWLSSFNIFDDTFEFAGQEIYTFQPGWADDFYNLVTGRDPHEEKAAGDGNVILTGHSLGGSLAGFVGARSGDERYYGYYGDSLLNVLIIPVSSDGTKQRATN